MKTILAYGLHGSTDLFYELELLWKSFKFSCHAIPGDCTWRRNDARMVDPLGHESEVVCYMIHDQIEHL